MQSIELGMWQLEYNEAADEIRFFVNPFDRDAVLFSLTKANLTGFLEKLDQPETHRITLTGQPVLPQAWVAWAAEINDGEEDEQGHFNYVLNADDLTRYYNGPKRAFVININDSADRRNLASMLWEYWATEHILWQADNT